MPQLLLQGFPDGAIRIGAVVSVLKTDKRVTYFVGSDNYFSHAAGDESGFRFIMATLMASGHVRACDVTASPFGIPHRTLMNWAKQLADEGSDSFFKKPGKRRGGKVLTPEKIVECNQHLAAGHSIAETARLANVGDAALRKAVKDGRVIRGAPHEGMPGHANLGVSTKSERSAADAEAATGMGTACIRVGERMAAALGLMESVCTSYEPGVDVAFGGLLAGLPALCNNGLLSGLNKHLSLPRGYYSAMHILMVLGFMALARIRRPEGLRHMPPGELGKVLGLDRVPEVKTLREKIHLMAAQGDPGQWMNDLSREWMQSDPDEAGYLYIDGHVRVYHGTAATLPRRYVTRERLCLRGTTDYWVNDALGRPFFVVSQTLTDGLATALIDQIVPDLIANVPGQPTEVQLENDRLLHRFVVVFDREGATYSLLSKLWANRIGAITYRKNVKDLWPEDEFAEFEVPVPGGGSTCMKLATRQTTLNAGSSSMPVLEVRRLTENGHQTAIITTARLLESPVIAGRMFARWCQENFFGYMMQHYDIDGLVQYGYEDIPGTSKIVNPRWRELGKSIRLVQNQIRKLHAKVGLASIRNEGVDIQCQADCIQDIQKLEDHLVELRDQRRNIEKKVTLDSLPKDQRPNQLLPLSKMLADTVKMIAYRAETALVGLIRKHLAKEDEARALIRELFVSSADIMPQPKLNALRIRIHRMASPVHDAAINSLLSDLNQSEFHHPQTGALLIYELV